MLKKMTIRNFKAIQDMTIEFTPLTVLIGGNSSGKSTVLQAFDFLQSAAFRDIPEYLRERGWKFEDLKSQLNTEINKPIEINTTYEFQRDDNKSFIIEWFFSVDKENDQWKIAESFDLKDKNKIFAGDTNQSIIPDNYKDFEIQSSMMKFIKIKENDYLAPLQQFLRNSNNYKLLSPDKMRMDNKDISAYDIGENGTTLVSYLYNMMPKERKEVYKLISDFLEYPLHVETRKNEQTGRLDLFINETFNVINTKIGIDQISDGLLRILALIAAAAAAKAHDNRKDLTYGLILFDEIEDGINPYLTEKVTKLLQDVIKERYKQAIITTHSPIIVNTINPDDIIFLWKSNDGSIHGKKMFSTAEMKRTLKVLNPGEVWINYAKEEILERLNPENKQAVQG